MNTIRRYRVLVLLLIVSQTITAIWLARVLRDRRHDATPSPQRAIATQPMPAFSPSPEPPPGLSAPRHTPTSRAQMEQAIDRAIGRAVAYLASQQNGNNWELRATPRDGNADNYADFDAWQWGGLTAMATWAMLEAGESPQSPRLKQAIEWLQRADVNGVYAVGLRCQVWQNASFISGVRQAARRDAEFLVDAQRKSQFGSFYGWVIDPKTHRPVPDVPNGEGHYAEPRVTLLGVMGARAVANTKYEISDEYWWTIESALRANRRSSGGWANFSKPGDTSRSENVAATAAAIATLYITQERAHQFDGILRPGNVTDPDIEAGLAWLGRNIHRSDEAASFYTLFAIQSAALGGGHKYLGSVNWQQQGLDHILWRQNRDGSFGQDVATNPRKIPDTVYALLFLARARRPVMVAKLNYEQFVVGPQSWNERPRDVANITQWVGRQCENAMNWRTVTLRTSLEDWHDAPVLWISGRNMLDLANADVAKLKRYIEEGGLVFGNADDSDRAFVDSFKDLGHLMFPSTEFRELPADHVIYKGQQFNRDAWPKPPLLLGLSNGVRELMILAPGDFGRSFQTQSYTGPNEAAAQAFANLCLYATDKNFRLANESAIVPPASEISPARTIRVARLKYAGNWNPEPAGWPRLARHLRQTTLAGAPLEVGPAEPDRTTRPAVGAPITRLIRGAALSVRPIELGDGSLLTSGISIAHLTGAAHKLQLSASQQEELRQFVKQGGTLIVDAAGGSSEFAVTAEALLTQLFPHVGGFQALAPAHPVYQSGRPIERFQYRPAARRTLGNLKIPRIRAATIDGRARIFFSAEDLSAGLVGQQVDGIVGYAPETALDIMTNILLYASGK